MFKLGLKCLFQEALVFSSLISKVFMKCILNKCSLESAPPFFPIQVFKCKYWHSICCKEYSRRRSRVVSWASSGTRAVSASSRAGPRQTRARPRLQCGWRELPHARVQRRRLRLHRSCALNAEGYARSSTSVAPMCLLSVSSIWARAPRTLTNHSKLHVRICLMIIIHLDIHRKSMARESIGHIVSIMQCIMSLTPNNVR